MIGKLIGSAGFLSSGGSIGGDLTITGDLTVEGSSTYTYDESVDGGAIFNESGNDVDFRIESDDNANMFFVDGGNDRIGIGVAAPDGTLHVYSGSSGSGDPADSNADDLIVENSTNGGISILTPNDSTGALVFGSVADAYGALIGWKSDDNLMTIATANAGDSMVLQTANKVTAVTIDSSQNVGIGVTPTANLHVKNPDAEAKIRLEASGTNKYAEFQLIPTGTGETYISYGLSSGGNDLIFQSYKSGVGNVVTFDEDGNVGIGESSPDRLFHIKGAAPYIRTESTSTGDSAAGLIEFYATTTQMGWVGFGSGANSDMDINNAVSGGNIDYLITGTSSIHKFLTDSDKVRFVIDDNSRISLSNNTPAGSSDNTVFGFLAGAGILSGGNDNTLIGDYAGNALSTSDQCVALGADALLYATTGAEDNVAIGFQSMAGNWTTATNTGNTAVGARTMDAVMTGAIQNTAIGMQTLSNLTSGDYNVCVGVNAGNGLISGSKNICIGVSAGDAFDAESDNVIIGHEALNTAGAIADTVIIGSGAVGTGTTTTGASGTVAIGKSALSALTSGAKNTAVGYTALMTEDVGPNNTAIGYKALTVCNNDTGMNTAVGSQAGLTLDAGNGNTLIGHNAAKLLTAGVNNVAIGLTALRTAALGESTNIAIGGNAMYSVAEHADGSSSANGNIAIGVDSMTGGALADGENFDYNIAIGENAMNSTGGEEQTGTIAIGYNALTALTSGAKNTAIGYQAGLSMNADDDNVYIGYESSKYMWGGNNVAVGKSTLLGVTFTQASCVVTDTDATVTYPDNANIIAGLGVSGAGIPDGAYVSSVTVVGGGTDSLELSAVATAGATVTLTFYSRTGGSVAIGEGALELTTTGTNTCIGANAGNKITTGTNNTIVGHQAGNYLTGLTTGSNNVIVGDYSRTSAVDSNHQISIGFNVPGGEDNQFTFGKLSNVVQNEFDTDAAWTRTSDERLKTNIDNATLGLDFVNDLRPVTYKWKSSLDLDSSDPQLEKLYNPDENLMNTDAVMHGLVAQEVKEALDTAGVDTFKGWSENSDGVQNISREMFVIPLIKAIQELSAKVEALENA